MKEATNELNLTVIVVLSVGILMAFFFTVMWPNIRNNYKRTANCKSAVCDCSNAKNNDYKCKCWSSNKDREQDINSFTCSWEG